MTEGTNELSPWVPFLAALGGGVITGGFTLLGVWWTHRNEVNRQKSQREALIKGVLQAIHDEIETLWERYMDAMGTHLEALADGQPLHVYYPITQDYFTMYSMNAMAIGHVPEGDLRKAIVQTYTLARSLIDSYRMNNELLTRYEQAVWTWHVTKATGQQEIAKNYLDRLTNYAPTLKTEHAQLKQAVNDLLRALRKKGVLTNQQS